MGEASCQVIIIEGEIALATIQVFGQKNPDLQMAFLEKAVEASCEGIHHASLYFLIEDEEDKLTSDYTKPIIDLHKLIINDLSDGKSTQNVINQLAKRLFLATRQLYKLYGEMPNGLTDIEALFHKLHLE